MDHGLYYVDRTGGVPVRIDEQPNVLTAQQAYTVRNYLDAAERNVTASHEVWGRIDNLVQAVFIAGRDRAPAGVYYVVEQRRVYSDLGEMTLLSGDLYPWAARDVGEKPRVLAMIGFVRDAVEAVRAGGTAL